MMPISIRSLSAAIVLMVSAVFTCLGQVNPTSTTPATQAPPLPITTQIKKTIAFLDVGCPHDFSPDVANFNKANLLQMQRSQRLPIIQRLLMLTTRLQNVRASMSKLSPNEQTRLKANNPIDPNNDDALAAEAEWRASILSKMSALTAEDIKPLTEQELALLILDEHRGTGFIVHLRDERTESLPGGSKGSGFLYLVTNKHVAEPGSESGKPCNIAAATIMLNHRPDTNHATTYAETIRLDPGMKWILSDDASVDLAVAPLALDPARYDFLSISDEQFITDDDIVQRRVVEGDPVLFSGLFVQTFDELHTLEPIIRFGTLAMIPNGLVRTTLENKPGRLYFAEAHAFGGNSGSPMFVDQNKFQNIIGPPNYRLLGVISGEVTETSDLKLVVTTTINGAVGANSDVSTIVPVSELLKILKGSQLEAMRVISLDFMRKNAPAVKQ